MKLGKYTLNSDGTVPDFVLDGGYLGIESGLNSPQDYYFVGIVEDNAPVDFFAAKQDLVDYLLDNGASGWVNLEGEPFDIEASLRFAETVWP